MCSSLSPFKWWLEFLEVLSGCGAKPGGSNCFTMWHWGAKAWGPAWINHRLLGCHHVPQVWLWWIPKLGEKDYFGFSVFFLKDQHFNSSLSLMSDVRGLQSMSSRNTLHLADVFSVLCERDIAWDWLEVRSRLRGGGQMGRISTAEQLVQDLSTEGICNFHVVPEWRSIYCSLVSL